MFGFARERLLPSWQFALIGLVIVALLACIGLGGTAIGWHLWSGYCFRAAEQALERKDFAAAQDYLTRCLEARPGNAEAHFLAARTARRALNYEEAERQIRECQKLGGVPELIDLERALTAAQRGNLTHVESLLLSFVHRDHPDAVLILEALSRGCLNSLRLEGADACLRLWLDRRPDDVQALLWLGEVQERLFHKKETLAAYRRAVELSPDQDDSRLHFAELLLRARQPEEAGQHLHVLRQRQPENTAVVLDLARCRRLQGKPAEARALLDAALEAAPSDAGLLSERGVLALESGQPGEAEPWLRKAVALAPFDRESVYVFSQCLQQCGKAAEAEEFRKKLEEIDGQVDRLDAITRKISAAPHDAALRHEAGMIFLQSGQPQQGVRWLKSALQINPLYPPTHLALADYFAKLGEQEQASWHRQLAVPNTRRGARDEGRGASEW